MGWTICCEDIDTGGSKRGRANILPNNSLATSTPPSPRGGLAPDIWESWIRHWQNCSFVWIIVFSMKLVSVNQFPRPQRKVPLITSNYRKTGVNGV